MRPETVKEQKDRERYQSKCKHTWGVINMPYDWEILNGSLDCEKCGYGIPIEIYRVKTPPDEADTKRNDFINICENCGLPINDGGTHGNFCTEPDKAQPS